jgi:uncharacterized protein
MRQEITFNSDGVILRGWLYLPDLGEAPFPSVIMAHGFALVKEQGLDRYAEVFAAAGLASVVFDNRNLGASDGEPRQDIDPWQQARDYRSAITFAQSLPELDENRVGIWGTSYSGAVALHVAAVDRRLKAVVVQVPGISGCEMATRLLSLEQMKGLRSMLDAERTRLVQGEKPATIQFVAPDPSVPAAFPEPRSYEFYTKTGEAISSWRNEITIRSLDRWLEHDVIGFIKHISPIPLLAIIADQEQISPTDLQIAAFTEAREPKKLIVVPGDHYVAYQEQFSVFASEAANWFVQYVK